MSRLVKILIAVVVGLAVVAGGLFAFWYFVLKSDPEPRAKIKETPVVTDPGSVLDGTYTLTKGDANSFVGYRVTEQFAAAIVESEATGRTSDVEGSFSIQGTTADNVDVTADLRTLKSDKDMRDSRIHTLGLESDKFPESKFVLTEPIDFGKVPAAGETVNATAVGDFTLHGVMKRVSIPVEARWDGRDIQVVGHIPIVFADYDMDAPNIGGFVSVKDNGEMEFQIFFRKT